MPCGCGGNNQITKYRVTHDGTNHDFLTIGEANKYRKDNAVQVPARPVKVNKK